MSEARIRFLKRQIKLLNALDLDLREEEWDLSAEQYVIEDFEWYYVENGESISKVKSKSHISQFDEPTRKHVVKHVIVKVLKKTANHELMILNRKKMRVVRRAGKRKRVGKVRRRHLG
jgi:hypothetical protein